MTTQHPAAPLIEQAEQSVLCAMRAHLEAICGVRPDVYRAQHVAPCGDTGCYAVFEWSPRRQRITVTYSSDHFLVSHTTTVWAAEHRPERRREVLTARNPDRHMTAMPPKFIGPQTHLPGLPDTTLRVGLDIWTPEHLSNLSTVGT